MFISLSNRRRGSTLRIHKTQIIIVMVITNMFFENSMQVNDIMKMMLEYSAIKIIENSLAPYSVLNPLTSSLSPSAKS